MDALQVAPLFAPWTFVSESEVEAADGRPVIHLTDAGVQLFNELPAGIRDWACAWSFTFRALSGGMLSMNQLDQAWADLLAEPEARQRWVESVSVDQIEQELRRPYKFLESEVVKAIGLDVLMSKPGVLIKSMVEMQSGDAEQIAKASIGDTDIVPESGFIAKMIAMERSMVARICFGRPFDELLKAAEKPDLQSLVDAIRVYPGVLSFPSIAKQYAEAVSAKDATFISRVSNAQHDVISGIKQYELNMNHCLSALKKAGGLSRLNSKLSQFIFLEVLPPLYPSNGEDPIGGLNKKIQRFKKNGRTFDLS